MTYLAVRGQATSSADQTISINFTETAILRRADLPVGVLCSPVLALADEHEHSESDLSIFPNDQYGPTKI